MESAGVGWNSVWRAGLGGMKQEGDGQSKVVKKVLLRMMSPDRFHPKL